MIKKIIFSLLLIFVYSSPILAKPDCDEAIHYKEWSNCNGKMNLANGEFYSGEWKNGQKHGQGKFNYSDGSVYIGHFKAGKPYGKGEMKYADGGEYNGDFKSCR